MSEVQMTKWEYAVRPFDNKPFGPDWDFPAMGEKGWELVAVADGKAYFKRPVYEASAMVALGGGQE